MWVLGARFDNLILEEIKKVNTRRRGGMKNMRSGTANNEKVEK